MPTITAHGHYRSLVRAALNVDLESIQSDLSSHRVVITPMLFILTQAVRDALAKFAEEAGVGSLFV